MAGTSGMGLYLYKLTNQYNSLSQIERDYLYYYYGSNWNPSSRTSYTYTPSGKSETSFTEQYDSTLTSWEPSSSDSSAYNMNNQLTYNIYKRHDGSIWQDLEQIENFYQNDLITESVQTSWIYEPYQMWKYRDTFSYSAGNLVSQTSQFWENNQWTNQSFKNMSYNANNNLSIIEIFYWIGLSWAPYFKYIYSYISLVEVNEEELLKDFVLYQNYPNPFNSTTKIIYIIEKYSNISLVLYNSLGEKVKVLDQGQKLPGKYEIVLDDISLSSGVYFYELKTPYKSISKKMMLLK